LYFKGVDMPHLDRMAQYSDYDDNLRDFRKKMALHFRNIGAFPTAAVGTKSAAVGTK
jgi:hypothetical protein